MILVYFVGPLSGKTMALVDPTVDYPVKGKKRNVFVVAAESGVSIPNVLLIDPTGTLDCDFRLCLLL